MEIVSEVLSGTAVGLVGIVGFFVKKSLNDVAMLKNAQIDTKVMEKELENANKHIEKLEETMYKKFAGVHTKQEKQSELNSTMGERLASIDAKLDILINSK